MNRYEMIVIIVAIVMFASVLRARYRAREAHPVEDAEALRAKEELKTLRARVAVLERIATDKENVLEREIERLRDS